MSRNSGSRRWKNGTLYILLGVFITALLTNSSCSMKPDMATWHHSQFLERVESGQIEKVTINTDRTRAVVVTNDGQRVAVNLSSDPELIDILRQNNVDVSISSEPVDSLPLVLFALLIPFGVALAGFLFWIWVLIDCATKEAIEGNTKLVWVLIILFTNLLGAFVYFFVRRPQRLRELGQ